MRVLFTSYAWPSHHFPLVPLAWAMHVGGHEVRMAGPPELAATMLRSGLPSVVVGRDVDLAGRHRRAAEHMGALAEPAPGRNRLEFMDLPKAFQATRPAGQRRDLSLYGGVADAMADDLVALARRWRPDLVVFDTLTYAGPLAARVIGVPAVRLLFGPDVPYFTLGLEERLLKPVLRRFGVDDVDLLGRLTVDPCLPDLQFGPDVAPVARAPMRYVPYNGLSEIPDWAWQPSGRPRICLTWGTSLDRLLGTRTFLPAPVLRGCAEAAADRGAELVLGLTAGQRELLTELPDGVRVAERVPLQALLTSCQALVHHGGAGGMMTAVRYGVPQLVVPQMPDHVINANHLAGTGAGLVLHLDEADVSAVHASVIAVLDDGSYRDAAGRLRDEDLHRPSPADVVDDLQALVRGDLSPPPQPRAVWSEDMVRLPFDEYLQTLRVASLAGSGAIGADGR
jgi:UDP:flavonoid glycosyltransferase YjiC (YdhE family)